MKLSFVRTNILLSPMRDLLIQLPAVFFAPDSHENFCHRKRIREIFFLHLNFCFTIINMNLAQLIGVVNLINVASFGRILHDDKLNLLTQSSQCSYLYFVVV